LNLTKPDIPYSTDMTGGKPIAVYNLKLNASSLYDIHGTNEELLVFSININGLL
jgi:hypothetical protein